MKIKSSCKDEPTIPIKFVDLPNGTVYRSANGKIYRKILFKLQGDGASHYVLDEDTGIFWSASSGHTVVMEVFGNVELILNEKTQ